MNNENIYDAAYSEIGEQNIENNQNKDEVTKKKKKKKNKGNGTGKLIAALLVCSLLGGAVGSGVTYFIANNNINNINNINNTNNSLINNVQKDPATFLSTDSSSAMTAVDIYKKVAPAVVVVSSKSIQSYNGFLPTETDSIGSGFIINEDGYILTNYHVIEGATEVTVTLSTGEEVKASVVNYDQEQDVAMIKINGDVKVPGVVELGDSNALQPGEEVLAIGTPLSTDLSYTLTNGIISALNRNVETDNGVQLNLIQTNTAINPGNSGGPLINTKGQVVGINTLKMSGEVEGIGFAIPINDVKEKIESLSKPILTLGISIRTIDSDMSKELNMEQGLYIVDVNAFSPAEKAGLRRGDLIVKIDGTRIKTFDELKEIRNSKNAGDKMKIEYIRDGKTYTTDLTLEASNN